MAESGWLDRRDPRPPGDLSRAMVAALTEADVSGNRAAVLWAAGAAALDRALENPGRVRSSAFELLTADALITYACEAALETDDPEGAIESLVGQGMSR